MRKVSGVVLPVLVLSGCSASIPFVSVKALPGTYELKRGKETVHLMVNPNGTYSETIHHENGATEKAQSSWTWERHEVQVKNFLIPAGMVPDSLFDFGDGDRARRTSLGAIQFDWSLSAETTLSGKTTLYINPDSGPAFEKLSNAITEK
jgi:hypothetical protein